MITDLDRVFTFDQNYAHIIGHAMKGYSLTTDVYRSMMLQAMDACKQKGLHVPIVASDSAFQRLAVRGSNNEPLTLFQAQKDCSAEVTKLQKSAIIAKFRSMNKYREIPAKASSLPHLSKNTLIMIRNHTKGNFHKGNSLSSDMKGDLLTTQLTIIL